MRIRYAVALGACVAASLGAQTPVASSPRSAHTLIAEALTTAKGEHKVVLVVFGASWCGPCHQLTAFLQAPAIAPLMNDSYVIVNLRVLDLPALEAFENPGATELMEAMQGGDGIPYFSFLDTTGAKLVDSKVERNGTSIGYPATPFEIDAFDTLLQTTAPHMTAAQRTQIRDYLTRAAKG